MGLFKVPEDKPTRVLRAGSLLGRAWMEGDAEWDGRQDGKGKGEEFTAPEHLLRVVVIRATDTRGAASVRQVPGPPWRELIESSRLPSVGGTVTTPRLQTGTKAQRS